MKISKVQYHPWHNPKLTKLQLAIRVRNEMLCKTKGHHLVGCGYGGPDSGCDDHYCSRCGRYWSVPLY